MIRHESRTRDILVWAEIDDHGVLVSSTRVSDGATLSFDTFRDPFTAGRRYQELIDAWAPGSDGR